MARLLAALRLPDVRGKRPQLRARGELSGTVTLSNARLGRHAASAPTADSRLRPYDDRMSRRSCPMWTLIGPVMLVALVVASAKQAAAAADMETTTTGCLTATRSPSTTWGAASRSPKAG